MDVKKLRARTGLSQNKFADLLGVSVASLRRWELGKAKPSPMAAQKIREFENMTDEELIKISQNMKRSSEELTNDNYATNFYWKGIKYKAFWAPYVINGPNDQMDFYKKMLELQENADLDLSAEEYFPRLSLLRSVNGIETEQFKMEEPKNSAKSWSSDYGTHGFHRYVGRFPPHVIRAIINSFGAKDDDVILDPFCGSGTTLVEARMLGIKSIGIEISPLSAMISRVKSQFPINGLSITNIISDLMSFYNEKWDEFVSNRDFLDISYIDILDRSGNSIKTFPNIEKWFSKEALLGTSIIVEFILNQDGYIKDFLTVALSSKMRSIGNVDVDVVRAEYRKEPRENVDVLKLVLGQIKKMANGISKTIAASKCTINDENCVKVIEGNVLDANIQQGSVSYIITSPPYGVESLSYVRTHLLSFRALEPILGVDPYNLGEGVIGSEYLGDSVPDIKDFKVINASRSYQKFFNKKLKESTDNLDKKRVIMMMQFFEDMYNVIEKFSYWLKRDGKIAFIIGNKKLGDSIIPTDTIIEEIFNYFGFNLKESIEHKLKTNNSNSKVPWQDRIIENEYIMFFERRIK